MRFTINKNVRTLTSPDIHHLFNNLLPYKNTHYFVTTRILSKQTFNNMGSPAQFISIKRIVVMPDSTMSLYVFPE